MVLRLARAAMLLDGASSAYNGYRGLARPVPAADGLSTPTAAAAVLNSAPPGARVLVPCTAGTALLDVAVLWAGQSTTTNPSNVDGMVKDLVGEVAGEMKKAGLVQKGQ
jgi:hypothetical protein